MRAVASSPPRPAAVRPQPAVLPGARGGFAPERSSLLSSEARARFRAFAYVYKPPHSGGPRGPPETGDRARNATGRPA
eukprot:4808319-Pyramimonas_sp.AAC.1